MSMRGLKLPFVGVVAGIASSAYIFWPLIQELRYVKSQKPAGAPLDAEAVSFMRQFGVPKPDVVAAAESPQVKEAAALMPKRHDDDIA